MIPYAHLYIVVLVCLFDFFCTLLDLYPYLFLDFFTLWIIQGLDVGETLGYESYLEKRD